MSRPRATSRATREEAAEPVVAVAGKRRKSWTIFSLDGRTSLPMPASLGRPRTRFLRTLWFRPSPQRDARQSANGATRWIIEPGKTAVKSDGWGNCFRWGWTPAHPRCYLRFVFAAAPVGGPSGLGFFLTIVKETSQGLTQGRLDPVLSFSRSVMNHCAKLEQPPWKWAGRSRGSTPIPKPGEPRGVAGLPAPDRALRAHSMRSPRHSVDILWTTRGIHHGRQTSRIDSAR